MAEIHQIRDLLSAAAVPSADELEILVRMGAFTTDFFARQLHGVRVGAGAELGADSGAWVDAVTTQSGMGRGADWSTGLGLGAGLLEGGFAHFFQVAATGLPGGYDTLWFDDYHTVDFYDDDWVEVSTESQIPRRARRSSSLFGRRGETPGNRHRSQTPRRQKRGANRVSKLAERAASPEQLAWADGSTVVPAVVDAFEQGGLHLEDQLFAAMGPAAQSPLLAAAQPKQPKRVSGASWRPVALDGLTVDRRTPALRSALTMTAAAFGDDAMAGTFAANPGRRTRMLQALGSELAVESRGTVSRPVFSFFDAVEGDFLSLVEDVERSDSKSLTVSAATRLAGSSASYNTPVRLSSPTTQARPLPRRTTVMPPSPSVQRRAVLPVESGSPQRSRTRAFDTRIQSSLTELVAAPVAASRPVSAFSQGVFPSRDTSGSQRTEADWQFASAVSYNTQGTPQARVQRGGATAPRTRLLSVSARSPEASSWLGLDARNVQAGDDSDTPGQVQTWTLNGLDQPSTGGRLAGLAGGTARVPGWRLAADGGPDLPLGATLTASEAFTGALAMSLSPGELGELGTTDFRPVISAHYGAGLGMGPAEPATAVATRVGYPTTTSLDGLTWVAMASDDVTRGPANLALSSVPSGRPAVMIPAQGALDLQRGTRSLMTRAVADTADAPLIGGHTPVRQGRYGALSGVRSGLVGPFRGSRAPIGGDEGTHQPATWQMPAGSYAGQYDSLDVVTLAATDRGEATSMASGALSLSEFTSRRGVSRGPRSPSLTTRNTSASAPSLDAQAGLAVHSVGTRGLAQASALGLAPSVAHARAVRKALQRPVSTARETLVTAPFFGGQGTVSAIAAKSGEHIAARQQLPALVQHLVSTEERHVLGSDLRWLADVSTVDHLGALAPQARVEVARELRLAGWTSAELDMLDLLSPVSDESSALARAGQRASASRGRANPSVAGATVPMFRRVANEPAAHVTPVSAESESPITLTRNLARVLTGTEALSGTQGSALGASSHLTGAVSLGEHPMLASRVPDSYFGAQAPQRHRLAPVGTLRDAIGDLVALAATTVAEGDRSVPGPVAARLMARLERSFSALEQPVRSAVQRAAASGLLDTGQDSALLSTSTFQGLGLSLPMAQALAAASRGLAANGAVGRGYRRWVQQSATGSDRSLSAVSDGYHAWSGADLTALQLASDGLPSDVAPEPRSLAHRVRRSLAASSEGPAGKARLRGRLGDAADSMVPVALRGDASVETLAGSVMFEDQPRGASTKRGVFESALQLDAVLAPEAMLGGMEAPAQVAWGRELPGQLVAAGDLEQRVSSGRAGGDAHERSASKPAADVGSSKASTAPGKARGGTRLKSLADPIARLIASVDSRGGQAVTTAGTIPERLSALIRRLDRGGVAMMAHTASTDFALAWLNRVDGTRSGVDVGLGEARGNFVRAFGDLPTSQVAANSPLHDASHVSPSVSSAKSVAPDRSGVRRMARAAQASGRSVRAQHGAAAAAQSIDWNYVKTGSKASTPHANLGGMAASALGSAASASRVPLPLVAPAVKAVAQAAHRKPTSEAIVSDSTGDGSASLSEQPTEGAASGTSDGMSNGELQALATEIAERISRRTRRENERRGIWA